MTVFRLLVLSLLVGAGLSLVNITITDLLGVFGLSAIELWIYLHQFVDWAIPNVLLGAVIVIPAWLVFLVFQAGRE